MATLAIDKTRQHTQEEWLQMDRDTFVSEIRKRAKYAKTEPRISLEDFRKHIYSYSSKIAK